MSDDLKELKADLALVKLGMAGLVDDKDKQRKEIEELRQRVIVLETTLEEVAPQGEAHPGLLRELKEEAIVNYPILHTSVHQSKILLFVLAFCQARSLKLAREEVDNLSIRLGTHLRGKRRGKAYKKPNGGANDGFPVYTIGEKVIDTQCFSQQLYERNGQVQRVLRGPTAAVQKQKGKEIDVDTSFSVTQKLKEKETLMESSIMDLTHGSEEPNNAVTNADDLYLNLSLLSEGKMLTSDIIHKFFEVMTQKLPVDFVSALALASHQRGRFTGLGKDLEVKLDKRMVVFGLVYLEEEQHFQAYVIDRNNRVAFLYDPLKNEPQPIPEGIFELLPRRYQYLEIPDTVWTPQTNGVDCGVFVCAFLLHFLHGEHSGSNQTQYRELLLASLKNQDIDLGAWGIRGNRGMGFPPKKEMAPETPTPTNENISSTSLKRPQTFPEEDAKRVKAEKGKGRGEVSPTKATRGADFRAADPDEENYWLGFAEKQATFHLTTWGGKKNALHWLTNHSWVRRIQDAKKYLVTEIYPKNDEGEQSTFLSAIDSLGKDRLKVLAKILGVTFPLAKTSRDTNKEYIAEIKKKINSS